MNSLRALRDRAVAELKAAGVPDPEVDSELLLGHVLGLGRGEVQARIAVGLEADGAQIEEFGSLVARRAAREPLQHLTGLAPFRGLELLVGSGVFVPRPETEIVAQLAIDALAVSEESDPVAVDLGTGSGAIALSIATEVPRARVYGVERSPQAHEWAKRNAVMIAVGNFELVLGDLATALPELEGTVSVVVSNPPYIPIGAIPRDPEVRLFDPEAALYGGEDGLDVVRVISKRALSLLRKGGVLVLEHGELQAEAINMILEKDGWCSISAHKDLLDRDRATTAIR
ncbi:MAG: peptide chain release factor N(5)-glutamine methyltransferase [Homoserinimonas sp.]|nr:peptide chain release factor N(5)-glutamine methyltransferase [Cryobacterium sp.]MCO5293670.1 peptide chain release factor N(5)-glutamine methyltransferase [Homoserinimonas sp.]MCW5944868.1 peptide chain release factor N(5)-glutamine methyltransferase [Cryobacterium sp.]